MSDASAVGDASEWMDAAIESFGEPGKWLERRPADGADPTKPDFGNITWNALRISNVQGLFGFAAGNLSHHEVLLRSRRKRRHPGRRVTPGVAAGDTADVVTSTVDGQAEDFAELKRTRRRGGGCH